jgi:hypothetical protein
MYGNWNLAGPFLPASINALALRKDGSGRGTYPEQESTNAMPQEVERMNSVVNVRKNWGKRIRESRKRNKSKDPVRSPDWYAG